MREDEHHTTWYVSALTMALATRWLNDGTAWRRLLAQRANWPPPPPCQEHLQVFQLARQSRAAPTCGSAAARRLRAFAKRALAAGVVVVPSSVLAAGRPHAADGVRISIGAPPDRKTLAEGLARLARLVRPGR